MLCAFVDNSYGGGDYQSMCDQPFLLNRDDEGRTRDLFWASGTPRSRRAPPFLFTVTEFSCYDLEVLRAISRTRCGCDQTITILHLESGLEKRR